MLTKTDAIVLKTMKYGDTSKIVTFYTRQFGKLKGIAKGARANKNKFGASLEPATYVGLLLYKKEHRELHLISQADLLNSYKKIHAGLERMSAAMSVIELVNQVAHDEEENKPLFELVETALSCIEAAEANPQRVFHAFELRLASIFGFAASLSNCSQCGKSLAQASGEERAVFQLAKGAVLCGDCVSTSRAGGERNRYGALPLQLSVLKIFHQLMTSKMTACSSIVYDGPARNEIDETLRLYLRYHFEELKPSKSARVFQQLLV